MKFVTLTASLAETAQRMESYYRLATQCCSSPTPEPANTSLAPELQEPFVQVPTSLSTSVNKPHISFINASAYQRACKSQGATPFQLLLSVSQELTGRIGQVEDDSHDLSKVSVDYH